MLLLGKPRRFVAMIKRIRLPERQNKYFTYIALAVNRQFFKKVPSELKIMQVYTIYCILFRRN